MIENGLPHFRYGAFSGRTRLQPRTTDQPLGRFRVFDAIPGGRSVWPTQTLHGHHVETVLAGDLDYAISLADPEAITEGDP